MAKPLKFHQTLNQAPRSAKHHGKHRRAGSSAHGSPVVGTDYSAGGSSADVTVYSWTTTNRTITWDSITEPKPPTVPYAGIRTGELIGHRLWWLIGGELYSLAHKEVWKPGETKRGDLDDLVSPWHSIWGGIYSFFSLPQIDEEVEKWREAIKEQRERKAADPYAFWVSWNPLWEPLDETETLVRGTVKLWGDVIEHECGYRAEFAKINSLDAIYGNGDLETVRSRYGVP